MRFFHAGCRMRSKGKCPRESILFLDALSMRTLHAQSQLLSKTVFLTAQWYLLPNVLCTPKHPVLSMRTVHAASRTMRTLHGEASFSWMPHTY